MKVVCALCSVFVLIASCSGKRQPNDTNANAPQSVTPSDRTNNQAIDLSQIGHITPKGRVQDKDYNNLIVVDRLIAKGTESIPFLISKLEDETELKGHVIGYWYKVTVGDVALVILSDFFTDSTWENATIPGVGWDQMLERRNADITGEEVLREFIAKHGREVLKEKWQRIWEENRGSLYWDRNERCFKVKAA